MLFSDYELHFIKKILKNKKLKLKKKLSLYPIYLYYSLLFEENINVKIEISVFETRLINDNYFCLFGGRLRGN